MADCCRASRRNRVLTQDVQCLRDKGALSGDELVTGFPLVEVDRAVVAV